MYASLAILVDSRSFRTSRPANSAKDYMAKKSLSQFLVAGRLILKSVNWIDSQMPQWTTFKQNVYCKTLLRINLVLIMKQTNTTRKEISVLTRL
jgi:hypothetical protein